MGPRIKDYARGLTGTDEQEQECERRKERRERGKEWRYEGRGRQRPDQPETPRITLTTAQCLPLSSCHRLEVLKSLTQHFLRN